jgi:hypothetical protein
MVRTDATRPLMPRKALCTIAYGSHRELSEIARPTLEQFADRNGYDLVVVGDRLASGRPASWSKILLLHQLVQQYDLVLWIDADALFVDPTRDIASEIKPFRFLHLVSHRIASERVFNCGVMALRGGAVSRRFLERVWNQHDLVHHEWWENAAVLRLLGYRLERPIRPERPSPWLAGVGRLDGAWNSIPECPSPRPVIAHFPAMTQAARAEAMRAVAG